MVYDGVEITVRKVIHTEDYRLRLIALRVRPGAGLPSARQAGLGHQRPGWGRKPAREAGAEPEI